MSTESSQICPAVWSNLTRLGLDIFSFNNAPELKSLETLKAIEPALTADAISAGRACG